MTSTKLTNWEDRDVRNLITSWADHKEMFGGKQTGTSTYRGLRPSGTTFYRSEILLLLPPNFPGFFPDSLDTSEKRRKTSTSHGVLVLMVLRDQNDSVTKLHTAAAYWAF